MTHLPNICLIGKAGAGKTAVAELLIKHYGYDKLSFAAPLKAGCATTTDRGLLQRVGMGVRELHPDFWVNLLLDSLNGRPTGERLVIDDARFPNEILRLKLHDFVVVRVVAPVRLRVERLKANGKLQDEAQLEHPSELQLDDYEADHRLVNDEHVDALAGRLADLLNVVRS